MTSHDPEGDRINAATDAADDEFLSWCEDNDVDPEENRAYDEYEDAQSYAKDPYAYNGLRQSDFY